MKVGTKSLLFGAHQFLFHPLTVVLAWRKLYGAWPGWREFFCIVVHDWGYWGRDNIDGVAGKLHPYFGAKLAGTCFGAGHYWFTLLHSRSLAARVGMTPSKLCWADKLAIRYEPAWFYVLRTTLTGEIAEYRQSFADRVPLHYSGRQWLNYVKQVEVAKDIDRMQWLGVNFVDERKPIYSRFSVDRV